MSDATPSLFDEENAPAFELPGSWQKAMASELSKPYVQKLADFVRQERETQTVYPPEEDVFNALKATPYESVKVFLLGQDPYHGEGQAHGLCFSVRPGVPPPPSLVNIYKEMKADLGSRIPNNGYLLHWAEQGVLMLNAVLTVRANTPTSHKGRGWEEFTDAILRQVSAKPDPVVFILWGAYAQKKAPLIDTTRHTIVQSAHPSPLSAKSGFFGSRPFSKVNAALERAGKTPIDWQIPDL